MTRQFYYLDPLNETVGPISKDVLHQLHRSGTITDDTMVAEAGAPDWKTFGKLKSLLDSPSTLPPVPRDDRAPLSTPAATPPPLPKIAPSAISEVAGGKQSLNSDEHSPSKLRNNLKVLLQALGIMILVGVGSQIFHAVSDRAETWADSNSTATEQKVEHDRDREIAEYEHNREFLTRLLTVMDNYAYDTDNSNYGRKIEAVDNRGVTDMDLLRFQDELAAAHRAFTKSLSARDALYRAATLPSHAPSFSRADAEARKALESFMQADEHLGEVRGEGEPLAASYGIRRGN